MSRPSTEIIEKYNIIEQFMRYTQLVSRTFSNFTVTCSTCGDENNEVYMSLFCVCVCVCLCQGVVLKH